MILGFVCLSNLALGLFVLSRNTHSRLGQSFFAITILISSWAFFNYFTDNSSTLAFNRLFNALSFLFAFLALLAAAVFSYYFTGRKTNISAKYLPFLLLFVVGFGVFSVSHLASGTVDQTEQGLVFGAGQLLFLYVLVLVFILGLIIKNLFRVIKSGTPIQKNQSRIVFLSFTGSIVIALFTNAILPSISKNWQTAKVGPPILSFLVVSCVSYAIVRHRLFDIRLLVARSFAYLLTLGALAIAYSLAVFGLTSSLFSNSSLKLGQQFFYVVFTLFAALIFQPVKKIFDRLSNKIFLRDYYDPQDLLDNLGNWLVGSVDPGQIKKESANIISNAIKPVSLSYLLFYDQTLQDLEGKELLRSLMEARSDSITTDELTPGHPLHRVLTEKNIAVVVSLKTKTAHLGFLILGYKQSGSIYSESDIRALGIAADEIAISLQSALRFEEIRRFNITLQQKIDEATRELEVTNRKLKELDATKDEFISMASHQLRTPLTAIKGYLSMVLEGDVGPVSESEKVMIKRAFDGAQKMVYLIADLLNVSRLQSGKFIIDNKPTNLAEVVDSEVSQLLETAHHRKISLSYQKPATFPTVMMDDNKIRQVIMNFIDNAIYYTPSGGKVTAVVNSSVDKVEFTVSDTGVGVPKEVQPKLFAKFYRADNARKMRPDGTGLGLFTARKVIDAQGGEIIFQSEEGKGSTFGFRFPIVVQAPPAPMPPKPLL